MESALDNILTILESARKVVDGYVIEAPKALNVNEKDFVERVLMPSAPVLGQMADVASTIYALNNGLVEGNPVMKGIVKNLPLFAALKVAVGVGTGLVIRKIENKGHKRLVTVLSSLAGFIPAASNVIMVSRNR